MRIGMLGGKKELAPRKSLWKDYFKDKNIDWEEYSRRYKLEILENPLALKALNILASLGRTTSGETSHEEQHGPQSQRSDTLSKYNVVTLLCHCKGENHCHRFLVKNMVKEGDVSEGRRSHSSPTYTSQ